MDDDIELIDMSWHPVAVEKGDRVVLASDDLMTLDKQEIVRILQQTQDAALADSAAALIQAVEEAKYPYQDNATVLLYTPTEGTELATTLNGPQEEKEGTNYE